MGQFGYVKRTLLEISEVREVMDREQNGKNYTLFSPHPKGPLIQSNISRGAIAMACISQSNMEMYCSVDCMI